MNVKTPCSLGETFITPKGIQTLSAVTWFSWTNGVEFTYFYKIKDKWHSNYFVTERNPTYDTRYMISDKLIRDGFLKEKGYPIKGRGYVYGLKTIEDKLYVNLILTDMYYAHIYVPCNIEGKFHSHGPIIVPPSWDTEEKRKSILLSKYNHLEVVCLRL